VAKLPEEAVTFGLATRAIPGPSFAEDGQGERAALAVEDGAPEVRIPLRNAPPFSATQFSW
jgi:hypothetical protein